MESISHAEAASRRSVYSGPAVTAALVAAFAGAFIGFAAWTGHWYTTWKALHVLMAIVWVGGALMIQLFAFKIMRADDDQQLATFARDVEFISMRTFIPASLILVVLGFVLIHQAGWAYHFWIVFALAVWALSFITGAGFLGPESGRIAKRIDEGGVDAELRVRIERVLLISRVELVLLALVAMDMVLKPGA